MTRIQNSDSMMGKVKKVLCEYTLHPAEGSYLTLILIQTLTQESAWDKLKAVLSPEEFEEWSKGWFTFFKRFDYFGAVFISKSLYVLVSL